MIPDNKPEFNYGLTNLKSVLDNGLHKSSSLHKTINPKSSSVFYVVTLFNQGVEGMVRAGFSLRKKKLSYKINDKEIPCGQVYYKN